MTCRTASLNNLPSINPFQIQEKTPRSGFFSENLRSLFFYEVVLFTCQTARCYRPRVTAVSHYSHDASVGKCTTVRELSSKCGSVLSQQAHQLCCKSPLCAASKLLKPVGNFACLVFQKTCSPVQMDQSRNQYRPHECGKAPP
jgi:hypothetical protein